ncbi:MAG TPA: type III pantothenate kinase [Acidobacteriota bacterium]|nr:type III pantothenate kinase [Acidobacteriota bacterium]
MLLVIDVGNTHTAIGTFSDKDLVADWRLATDRYRTADEWGQLILNLLHLEGMSQEEISSVAIACVVPPLEGVLERMSGRYFKIEPMFVNRGVDPGIAVIYDAPTDVGADRIANAVAAVEKYGAPAIIIDFGTATTFDAVNGRGEYIGGVICPGIGISATALFEKAARLPRIDIVRPEKVIGGNTVGSMQSGLYYGYLEQVRGITKRMNAELAGEGRIKVILTGGLARVFAPEMGEEAVYDPTLTLEGLRLIYQRNRG